MDKAGETSAQVGYMHDHDSPMRGGGMFGASRGLAHSVLRE